MKTELAINMTNKHDNVFPVVRKLFSEVDCLRDCDLPRLKRKSSTEKKIKYYFLVVLKKKKKTINAKY